MSLLRSFQALDTLQAFLPLLLATPTILHLTQGYTKLANLPSGLFPSIEGDPPGLRKVGAEVEERETRSQNTTKRSKAFSIPRSTLKMQPIVRKIFFHQIILNKKLYARGVRVIMV